MFQPKLFATKGYSGGELHQRCEHCQWWQTGHHIELVRCPECEEALRVPVCLEFGGMFLKFDGTRFSFHDINGRWVSVDEADYPDIIQFMSTHGHDWRAPVASQRQRIKAGRGDYEVANPRFSVASIFSR